jgi:hypothetical protein
VTGEVVSALTAVVITSLWVSTAVFASPHEQRTKIKAKESIINFFINHPPIFLYRVSDVILTYFSEKIKKLYSDYGAVVKKRVNMSIFLLFFVKSIDFFREIFYNNFN